MQVVVANVQSISDEEKPFISIELDNQCLRRMSTFFCFHAMQLSALMILLLCCGKERNNNTAYKGGNKAWRQALTNWHNSRTIEERQIN